MTAPKGSEGLVEKLEEIAAEDAMILTLPWPQIKHAPSQAAQRIKELEGALQQIRSQPTLVRSYQDSTMRTNEHEVLSAYDVRKIVEAALNQQEPGNGG